MKNTAERTQMIFYWFLKYQKDKLDISTKKMNLLDNGLNNDLEIQLLNIYNKILINVNDFIDWCLNNIEDEYLTTEQKDILSEYIIK